MNTLNYTVLVQMVNLTVYRLIAVDDTITYLIEDCNEFTTTTNFNEVLSLVTRHMRVFAMDEEEEVIPTFTPVPKATVVQETEETEDEDDDELPFPF